jgi:hypothetical protein
MKRSLKFLGLFALIAVVLVGATGCGKKSPEQVIKKMMSTLSKVETLNLDIRVALNGQFPQLSALDGGSTSEASSIMMSFAGDIDMESEESVQYQMTSAISNKSAGSEMKISGEVLSKEGIFYVKLSETPDVKIVDLSSLKGMWYKFDLDSLAMAPKIETEEEETMSKSQIRKMKKLLAKTEFFRVVKDHGEEEVNGVATNHYEVKVNQAELENFFREGTKLAENRSLTSLEESEMKKTLQKFSEIDGDLWIGKKDFNLYRVELSGQQESADGGVVRYDIAANMKNFGKKVTINKPADVREFDMMSMFAPQLGAFDNLAPELDIVNNEDIMKQFEGMEGFDQAELEKQLEELQKQFEQ